MRVPLGGEGVWGVLSVIIPKIAEGRMLHEVWHPCRVCETNWAWQGTPEV
jgi:hypothetical protein